MLQAASTRNRSPLKQTHILDSLRGEIVTGKIQPGQRMPTRMELERRFQVSNATLQRALDRLMKEGFAYAKGTMGTYVADQPPHLANIGIVLPMSPTSEGFVHFYKAISQEAKRYEQQHGRPITVYYGNGAHADDEDFRRLDRHVRQHRVAGLIFMHRTTSYAGTPILDEPEIPRVALGESPIPGIAVMRLVRESMITQGLDHLASKGRKRLAIIGSCSSIIEPGEIDFWMREAEARGFKTGLHRIHGLSLISPASAANVARLLMFGAQHERPDALMILDDNLAEHATVGLLASGVRVPEDLEIVSHCNFPLPTPNLLPVTRIGFDIRDLLHRSIETIDAIRRGEPIAPVTEISVVHESDTSV